MGYSLPVGNVTFGPGLVSTNTEFKAMVEVRDTMICQQLLRDRPKRELTPIEGVTLIGFGHKARHGKDYAAKIIHEAFPAVTQRFAIADGIRMLCRTQYGMTEKDAPLLQRIGTEWRDKDPGVWIRALHYQIAEVKPAFALITDIRMRSEADWITQMGGVLVKVTRFNDDGTPYVDPSRDPQHITETDLDGYVFGNTLTNRGDERFQRDVLSLFETLDMHDIRLSL
jgi:hypothetical protein